MRARHTTFLVQYRSGWDLNFSVKLKWRKVPPLKTWKICYCGGNIAPMTTLT